MIWKNRSGSAAVLLIVLFSCLIVVVTVLFTASKAVAGKSCIDASLQLAGRSVLSEYDKRLFSDYGLFAFKGDGAQVEKDIAFYAAASLSRDKTPYALFTAPGSKLGVFDYKIDDVNANLKEYSLMNVDLFEEQLADAALSEWIRDKTGDHDGSASSTSDRTLRNKAVIEGLPSQGLSGISFPDLSNIRIPTLSEIADRTTDRVLVSEYILSVFKNANNSSKSRDSFFENEVEYILSGKMTDSANYSSVRMKLYLVRFALNNVALLRDPIKMAKVKAEAAPYAALFGIGEEVASAIITEAWVAAETENDMLLLEDDRSVALVKSAATWAIQDINRIAERLAAGITNTDKVVLPLSAAGQSYEDYLRILLFLTDRETKLLRAMDLIQINMKGTYDRAFQIREHYAGFRFDAAVGGEEYSYTERYDGG